MSKRVVTLEDKYAQEGGSVFLTGLQALVRLPLEQSRRDESAGLKTAGFISGYRGSPLGGYDQQVRRAEKFLNPRNIRLWEGLNEDLAATAVWGSQQVGLFPGARYEGVFGLWYGKAPGVDRTGDAFKHANFAGTAPLGGVLAVAGDDHTCKSSTLPSQSELALADCEIPVLNPAGVQDVLDFGLYGWAMSRFSGLWVGLIAIADTMDSAAVVNIDPERLNIRIPTDFIVPPDGLWIRRGDTPKAKEERMRRFKLPAAQAFVRANRLDRDMLESAGPRRMGIVAPGQAVGDVFEALECLGLSPSRAAEIGIGLYKVAMPWPLEPEGIREFAAGRPELLIVEHKRALVERQLKEHLYGAAHQPRIIGKRDEFGARLLSDTGALSIPEIAQAIYQRLPEEHRTERAAAYFARVGKSLEAARVLETDIHRKPHYCSGCPHNISTVTPEGSRALAGIGCHFMATFMGRADMGSQMGGEGAAWIGEAPFTDEEHVFVNLGDGTYSHSGSLAIRAAASAGVNVTYKILYNGAVAMTGGQAVETGQSVVDIVGQLKGEKLSKIVVVADDVSRYRGIDLGADVELHDRSELEAVQRELREVKGVSALIYDQVCATEKRRRIKRGLEKAPDTRAFINAAVCEGCGDCSKVSNCLSVEPLETSLGVKRKINQSSCNQDLSCVDGFCPSFVTLKGAVNAARTRPHRAPDSSNLPEPDLPPLDRQFCMALAGIGGTGVTTISAILGIAAHMDGNAATTLDMAGLAQKGGPVLSHVHFARRPEDIRSPRTPTASADVVIAGDPVVAVSADALPLYDATRTRGVVNRELNPTAEFIADRSKLFDSGFLRRRLARAVADLGELDAGALAETHLNDQLYANMILLGFAWGRGLVPVSRESLVAAVTLNGVDIEANLLAFDLGRVAALAPERLEPLSPPPPRLADQTLDDVIDERVGLLTAYQDADYADRYRDIVERARHREAALGLGLDFTRAVALNLAKLMAIKDEYEIGRLYSSDEWERSLRETFAGDFKLRYHLSPPLLAPKDRVTGLPRKMAFGGWMRWGFKALAALKGLRGGPLDLFGRTSERRWERALRDSYIAKVERLTRALSDRTHPIAVQIAAVPDEIRGFGHIKRASAAQAERVEAPLWAAFEAADAEPSGPAPAQWAAE